MRIKITEHDPDLSWLDTGREELLDIELDTCLIPDNRFTLGLNKYRVLARVPRLFEDYDNQVSYLELVVREDIGG